MKHILTLVRSCSAAVIGALALCASPLEAHGADYEPLPRHLAGSMMPYDFAQVDSTRIWPDSLRPVRVAYVARHGARYLSSASKVKKLQDRLYALAAHGLTESGRDFLALLGEVTRATSGRWGLLSPVGHEEERRLGDFAAWWLPEVFGRDSVRAEATYVPRVVQTMHDFTLSLAIASTDVEVSAGEGRAYSPLLRFFDTDSLYAAWRRDGDWQEVYSRFVDEHVSEEPALRILGSGCRLKRSELRKVTMEMYDVLQGLEAAGLPAPTDRFMTAQQYEQCWRADNLEHYLRNTISPLSSSASAASGLLEAIIDSADSGAKASLWFGHAETLMPLLSLMRLPGCFALPLDYDDLWEQWQDWDVVPLGANLMVVWLEGDSGATYAVVRLNGRYAEPIADRGYILPWEVLKEYWLHLIDSYAPAAPQE